MPYRFQTEKAKLPRDKDRRVRLTDDQHAAIRANVGRLSQRKLAAVFGVSRRTIQFVQSPEKLAANKERREERGGWEQYYDKETHAKAVREHRRYKQGIMRLLLDKARS